MLTFLQFVKKAIDVKKINDSQIININEVTLCFVYLHNRTVNKIGEKCISIITTGNEKTSITCILACAADGKKLKPMLIFE